METLLLVFVVGSLSSKLTFELCAGGIRIRIHVSFDLFWTRIETVFVIRGAGVPQSVEETRWVRFLSQNTSTCGSVSSAETLWIDDVGKRCSA